MREKTHLDLVQLYFDRHAQEWHDYYQNVTSMVDLILIDRKNIAVQLLRDRLKPGARILDAGCGAGILAIELSGAGFPVEGVDISPKMIEIAGQNLAAAEKPGANCRFRVGNVLEEALPDDLYDCIIALGFLQYQDDEAAALNKLNALLSPNGLLVISGPMNIKITNYLGLTPLLRKIKHRLTGKQPPTPNLLNTISTNYYSVRRFRQLLEDAGFKMLEYSGHCYIHFEYLQRLSFKTQMRLHNFFTSLSRFLPIRRFANDIVVIAQKPGDRAI